MCGRSENSCLFVCTYFSFVRVCRKWWVVVWVRLVLWVTSLSVSFGSVALNVWMIASLCLRDWMKSAGRLGICFFVEDVLRDREGCVGCGYVGVDCDL